MLVLLVRANWLFFVVSILCLSIRVEANATTLQETIGPVKVEIVERDGKYMLLRGGKPYEVKGAGIDGLDLESLAAHGGNSMRNWAVDHHAEPAQQLLDRAYSLGLTVSLCLEFARERHGFDYNDEEAVAEQFRKTKERVLRYKDHPALLTWIIGNEVNFGYENPKVFDAVNDVAKMIKEVDPNHPTTTALAGFDTKALSDIAERAPDLDFVSFQMYASLLNMPNFMQETGFNKPYFVTEWGSVGHWEVAKTEWDAPIENTSTEKAENYRRSYYDILRPYDDTAIGNYVFLWGQKQEKTPTWYGMFLEGGEETEVIDVLHHVWNGVWPDNRVPQISPITIEGQTAFDNVRLQKRQSYSAKVSVRDPENDPIRYQWEIRKESTSQKVGGDKEYVPPVIEGLIEKQANNIQFKAPDEPGAYRLFVYAFDGNNNAAHANIPFYVD
ncbi:hypothetical protein DRW07_17640 [Alteromonas sediminis]|uniref:Glycoside hydrolase family 2 catalytic domain-containing protein n=1 Tax=Alteromonas sediminis TaxID=2259342 RepID=A0A3N5YK12_9ALTE|nr:glycoside hydrolase family 2 TIM barrel-domain containing protein [Alteromonas sediminis]RPJ65131.1 hypothetical protein DRW07_17640 [Alteromonas sediminis]